MNSVKSCKLQLFSIILSASYNQSLICLYFLENVFDWLDFKVFRRDILFWWTFDLLLMNCNRYFLFEVSNTLSHYLDGICLNHRRKYKKFKNFLRWDFQLEWIKETNRDWYESSTRWTEKYQIEPKTWK